MDRAGVCRSGLREQDLRVFAVKEFVMEDVQSPGKSSASRVVAAVVRQFAGSRVERQVLAQVFDVVWQSSGGPPSRLGDGDVNQRRSSCRSTRPATTIRILEGVAS